MITSYFLLTICDERQTTTKQGEKHSKYIYQWPGKATGETNKEKRIKQNLPKPRKPKAEPGHYIDTNV